MIKKKQLTMFSTPVIAPLLRLLGRLGLRLTGWRTVGNAPDLDKYVLICAPHTSNWDFPMMLFVVLKFRVDVHWMGKHTLFPFPIRALMKWLGGIPINRSAAHNTVEQAAQAFHRSESLVLIITPEGTRSKVDRWKAGFYHIAQRAKVPVQTAFLDVKSKTVGFGPLFEPTGDYDADLARIQAFYQDKQGFRQNEF